MPGKRYKEPLPIIRHCHGICKAGSMLDILLDILFLYHDVQKICLSIESVKV